MKPNFEPGILKYNQEFFLEQGEKIENPNPTFSTFPNYISTENGGELFNYDRYMKEETQKGLKRNVEESKKNKQLL